MSFKTPDLCDAFEAELGKSVRVVAPMFQRYGGRSSFSGQIVTLKLFEDNSLVREVFGEDAKVRRFGLYKRLLFREGCGDCAAAPRQEP